MLMHLRVKVLIIIMDFKYQIQSLCLCGLRMHLLMFVGVAMLLRRIREKLCHIQCHLDTIIQYPPRSGGLMLKMISFDNDEEPIRKASCNPNGVRKFTILFHVC
jgi:hypothetical protein